MLKQLEGESEHDFDQRLNGDLALRSLFERAERAARSAEKIGMPKAGAARILAALSRLRAESEHRAPTWKLLAEVVGLAEAIPPERSAKRVRVDVARKGGTARYEHLRKLKADKVTSAHELVLQHARGLLASGTPAHKLVSLTAVRFPGYDQRNVRRILAKADLLKK